MPASVPHAAVTICALNYFGRALVLRESFLAAHPEAAFYIVLVERKDPAVAAAHPGVDIIWVEDLPVPRFAQAALKFDIIELSTNVKPTALKTLLERHESVLYIDPDIFVYASLTPIFDALETHAITVTPHALTPLADDKKPSELDFLRFGSFNLGFVGVNKSAEGLAFLDWWSDRCLTLGFYEPQSGLAFDQKWMDLAPCFFPTLHILRHPGMNVAFWNLHERFLSFKDGAWSINQKDPLFFFHFSSFPLQDPHAIANKQSRFPAESRPDVHPLFDDYATRLKSVAGYDQYASRLYSFDYLGDGSYITPMLRRVFAALEARFPVNEDPFAVGSSLQNFALKRGLALRNHKPAKRATFKDLEGYSRAARIIAHGQRAVLRVLGPERYFVLMRYLAHISSIRSQPDLVSYDP